MEFLGRQGQYKELFELANKAFLKWAKTDKDDSDGETQDFVCYVFDAWDAVLVIIPTVFTVTIKWHFVKWNTMMTGFR